MTHVVSENRVLAMVLAVLCVVVAVLAGFVVVGVNRGGEETAEVVREDTVDAEFEAEIAAQVERMEAEQEAHEQAMAKYNDIKSQVAALLNANPADVAAAINLYKQSIEEYLAKGELDRAESYILLETNMLTEAGFKQELLDALTAIDYEAFPEATQYSLYYNVVSLANELGDASVAAKYEPLMNKTKSAWDTNAAAAEASATEGADEPLIERVEAK